MAEEKKKYKIRITRSCIALGEHAEEGKTFAVPEDMKDAEAKYLVGINKAEVVDESKSDKAAKSK